ncbi:MAG TPA: LacI family DNA-binding transcriptional regulator [Candidatus Limnocylindrales bacterium]|nr:LacI family DNA-binding transcriptional regulator [Candidatus Limnocylindrales bacterium]
MEAEGGAGEGEVGGSGADETAKNATTGDRPRSVPTMRDIALVAGVSQSTVSRVLNDVPTRVPIAAETRERVTTAARKLGYRPNPLARGLRGAPTMLLGAVVRDITDPFFAGAIEALSVAAVNQGYNLVLGHARGRADEAQALTAVLETRHCDAIVLLGDLQDQPRLIADLADSLVPIVGLWQGSSPLEVPTVDVDNKAGIRAGLDHLVELGHERIAFVSGRPLGDIRERQAAFTEYVVERFGTVPDGYIQHVSNTPGGGEAALRALLALPQAPTAVVTSTDTLAVGALHAAYSRGVVVPTDLSVLGFDDILLASHTVPALTTLRMPIGEIVAEGVRLAIELARDPSARRRPGVRVMAPSLIVRQSTAPPSTN